MVKVVARGVDVVGKGDARVHSATVIPNSPQNGHDDDVKDKHVEYRRELEAMLERWC
jgi:hypothetical protein